MSDPSKSSPPDTRIPEILTADEQAAEVREHRRYWLERLLQIGVFVVLVGGWEVSARTGFADPFFFGQPSGIAATVWRWAVRGTPQGPLWQQVVVTLEETVLAFALGVLIGGAPGFALARIPSLVGRFGPVVRMGNAIPPW